MGSMLCCIGIIESLATPLSEPYTRPPRSTGGQQVCVSRFVLSFCFCQFLNVLEGIFSLFKALQSQTKITVRLVAGLTSGLISYETNDLTDELGTRK